MAATTCYSLLPELNPFLDAIKKEHPFTGEAVAGMLANFCKPWLYQKKRSLSMQQSLLTPGGYPIEFNFRSDDDAICYTTEVGLPGAPIESKLSFIRSLIPGFNSRENRLAASFIGQLNQRFGCWISMRHSNADLAYKVYYEVTQDLQALFLNNLYNDIPQLSPAIKLKPMLVGILPGTDGIAEYYFKLCSADRAVLHELFLAAGRSAQLPYILSCLSWLVSKQPGTLFRHISIGISYRVNKGGLPSLTLFIHCPEAFPSNRLARAQILSFAEQTGGNMDLYQAITAPLHLLDLPNPVHSILSIKPKNQQVISCSVGLRPW